MDLRKRVATAERELMAKNAETPSIAQEPKPDGAETKLVQQLDELQKKLTAQAVLCETHCTKENLEDARRSSITHLPWIGFEVTSSAVVKMVQVGSPAAECGIEVGDRCLMLADKPVASLDEFRAVVKGNVHPGMTVPFSLQRGGITKVVSILVRCISMKPKEFSR